MKHIKVILEFDYDPSNVDIISEVSEMKESLDEIASQYEGEGWENVKMSIEES